MKIEHTTPTTIKVTFENAAEQEEWFRTTRFLDGCQSLFSSSLSFYVEFDTEEDASDVMRAASADTSGDLCTVKVWLKTRAGNRFSPYMQGEEVELAFVKEYPLLSGIDPDELFAMYNGGSGQEDKDYFRAGNRSLSLGDVIAIDENVYACGHIGWQQLEAEPTNVV